MDRRGAVLLKRDGLRVQVLGVARYHLDATDVKPAQELLLVPHARESAWNAPTPSPCPRQAEPKPTLSDEAGKPYALQKTEFFDRGGGKSKTALFPFPTIEETFAFETPAEDGKTLHLALPAARWECNGQFQFMVLLPGEPPRKKK